MSKSISVDATKIEWPFFVRHSLNEDHALYLAELYQAGTKIAPIQVYLEGDKYIGIDGRHRYYAQTVLLDRTKIAVEVLPKRPEAETIVTAFRANLGGPLPPTKADIKHTIKLLMEKLPNKEIYKFFVPKFYDRATIRNYIREITTDVHNAKLTKARHAVLDSGKSIPEVAELYDLKEEQIQRLLGGKKKGLKINEIANIKQKISNLGRSHAQNNRAMMEKVIQQWENGNATITEVLSIVELIEGLSIRNLNRMKEWRSRVEQHRSNSNQ